MNKFRALFAIAAMLFASPLFAQTVTLTVTPTSGTASVTPTLTWSSTPGAFTSCTAGGGWSGPKATSGTETVSAIVRDTTYTLTCATPAGTTGSASLSWAPPTTRTDGSPLTNLAGYNIYFGSSASTLTTKVAVTNPAATTFTIANIPAGNTFFAMTSLDATGAESLRTNTVNVLVEAPKSVSIAATPVKVTVTTLPAPPTSFAVVPVLASLNASPVFRLRENGRFDPRVAGLIRAGDSCFGPVLFRAGGREYRRVQARDVDFWIGRAVPNVAAACDIA